MLTVLTGVGGVKTETDYAGNYRFYLGPGVGGEYHKLYCLGMDSVMAKFNKSNLSEIRSEFLSLLDPTQPVPPLPKYVRGSDSHLLIGIKNTSLNPVWIKTLPSGVAVYRSAFRDIWGSNIIFAGPHKTFTNANRGCAVN